MSDERRFATDAWQRLSLLVVGFGLWHSRCLDRVAAQPVSGLATVPSLRGRRGEHPLNGLVDHLPRSWQQFRLAAASRSDSAADRRTLDPEHFIVPDPASVAGRHLVVLEDTWVTGGHAQSAAAALRAAGAAEATIVPIARLLSPAYAPTRDFIGEHLDNAAEYDVNVCPVTGEDCPS